MRVVFVSNFFNHHQSSISDFLFRHPELEYRFIETSKVPEERIKLGYHTLIARDYVIRAYESEQKYAESMDWIKQADAVIFGSAPESMIQGRIKSGKPVFRYSERPLKFGPEWKKYPVRLLKWNYLNFPRKHVYLLAASAFAAGDYRKFGMFRGRAFQWGYFPPFAEHADPERLISEKDTRQILWVGRFIDWKRPLFALEAAKCLKRNQLDFRLDLIGDGNQRPLMENFIAQNYLSDCVRICPAMSPEAVRAKMDQAGILLFTSTEREGWGAVLNEAMNSGCTVAAADQIGSVPFLIKPNENGFVFHSENLTELVQILTEVLGNAETQGRIGVNAYNTIASQWKPEIAANRLAALIQNLTSAEKAPNPFQEGPCRDASIIHKGWLDAYQDDHQ
jgi:Glycosyltransferase